MTEAPTTTAPTEPDPADPPASARHALLASIFMIELGSSVTAVALPLLLLEVHGLGVAAGLAFAARMIPSVFFGPLVGDIIARRDPRKVAAVSAVGAALLVALVPWTSELWQIQALAFGVGLCHMFASPARLALRPRALKKGQELEGNGRLVSVERLPHLIGPPIVGFAWVSVGLHAVFLADAVACLIAAALVFAVPAGGPLVPADETERAAERRFSPLAPLRKIRRAYVDAARGMAVAVARDRFLLGLTLTGAFYVGAVAMGRLFLVQLADDEFGRISGFYGYLLGAMAVGAVLGGFWVGKFKKAPNGWLYIGGNVLEAVAWITVIYIGNPWAALALLFFAGLTEALATAVFFAEAQLRLPERYTGHYYAALVPFYDVFAILGSVIGAALAATSVAGAGWAVALAMAVPVILTARWYLGRYAAAPGASPA